MTFVETVKREGVTTHEDVPIELAEILIGLLRTAPVRDGSAEARESYEKLQGHALDSSLLKFKQPDRLQSMIVSIDAPPSVQWRSFACVVVVSPAPDSGSAVFKRVDIYSIFRHSKGPASIGDCYLRLDLANDGRVLDFDLNGIEQVRTPAGTSVYGTMLYFTALIISGAEIVNTV